MAKKVKTAGDLSFPEGFLWGASTSAHQTEGGTNNQWTDWEKKNADRLAHKSEKEYKAFVPDWEMIRAAATDPANYVSGQAADFYNRYASDFKLAKGLHLNAVRFSVEWSRVEPVDGKFDEVQIKHYLQMVNEARKNGLEPFVTLWHWTMPLWLTDRGGVMDQEFAAHFERYVSKMAKVFKGKVTFLTTLNEPEVYNDFSYHIGIWPPEVKGHFSHYRVTWRLIGAHKRAYKAIKKIDSKYQVGISKNNIYFQAWRKDPVDRLIKLWADTTWNYFILDRISAYQDFVGINYYFHARIKGAANKLVNEVQSDMGWELWPSGLRHVIKDVKKYKKPIYITEHGLADARDEHREEYIKASLRGVHRAIAGGADVRGYMHWALLDNFEWDKGFWPRFGLIEVDFETQKRTVRPSAKVYGQIAKANAVSLD